MGNQKHTNNNNLPQLHEQNTQQRGTMKPFSFWCAFRSHRRVPDSVMNHPPDGLCEDCKPKVTWLMWLRNRRYCDKCKEEYENKHNNVLCWECYLKNWENDYDLFMFKVSQSNKQKRSK